MKTVAIIQARMGSTRLPGKVLKDLNGLPVLQWVLRAARLVPGVDEVVVATSIEVGDQPIVDWCLDRDVPFWRGDEHNVLARFAGAALDHRADTVMRLTADCPFLDPQVCGTVLSLFKSTNADYTSNCSPANWPDGLDCEVFSRKALQEAEVEATTEFEQEHVTPFIQYNRARYRIHSVVCPLPNLHENRWTLDNPEDLDFLYAVVPYLSTDRPPSYLEILQVLDEQPELRSINAKIGRNEGSITSLKLKTGVAKKQYKRSKTFLARARQSIPLGAQTFSKSFVQFPNQAPTMLTYGDGGCVWDADGNHYVDMIMGLLPVILGYRDPDVDLAIREQLSAGISFSLATEPEVKLAEKLIEIIPSAEMIRFGKNGTDATSAAVRLSRAFTGRERIMACGYHGWQDWYVGATSRDKGVPASVRELTHLVNYQDLDGVSNLLKEYPGEFAAFIMEPANSTIPKENYLQELKELLAVHSTLLVFDEIITGFRFSLGGAQELFGVTPDLSCFGKAMGNGMPISAIMGRADIMAEMEEVFFSGTFGGEALSIAASLAVIKKMQSQPVLQNIWEKGQKLADDVTNIIERNGCAGTVSLVGLAPWKIISFQDHPSATKELIRTVFIQEMLRAGVLVTSSHNICYAHNEEDFATIRNAYERSLSILSSGLSAGNLSEKLTGPVINPVFRVR